MKIFFKLLFKRLYDSDNKWIKDFVYCDYHKIIHPKTSISRLDKCNAKVWRELKLGKYVEKPQ